MLKEKWQRDANIQYYLSIDFKDIDFLIITCIVSLVNVKYAN